MILLVILIGIGAADAAGMSGGAAARAAETTTVSEKPQTQPAQKRRPNRLAKEKSPYLLQHAYNPVDWYPWGDEAFGKAKSEDKPLFVSIGYSTCHWCHVMERESFEDEKVAAYLNENFVAVKVDREERPDVDAIYMTAVQAMTGSGGWPLSVFLSPDGRPFFGGTYYPPEDRFGRPGFLTVLQRIRAVWTNQRDQVNASSAQIVDALREPATGRGMVILGAETLRRGYEMFKTNYDKENGGFSPAPKFPRAHELSFLMRMHHRRPDAEGLAMIAHTLDAMAAGGIYDHLGGGFHRYSTDPHWLVPHFEKMLYDQALLARAYLEAYQITGNVEYARVARETFEYVLRDLADPKGGFHSAEDADSEGEEGKFYVWKPEEIRSLLGADAAKGFMAYYGVTEKGNFEHDTSILHVERPAAEVARELKIPVADLEKILADGRAKLLAARSKRIRPHLDDKVLADWNGLMISALAYGGAVLDEPRFLAAAGRSATFVLEQMQKDGRLLHRWRDGEAAVKGFLDDYAFFGLGLFDLYEATLDPKWLSESRRLAQETIRLFRDEADGALTLVGSDGERLIVATKEIYDGAIPSGNSVAAAWLLPLGRLTSDRDLEARGRDIIRAFSANVERYPPAYPYFLAALDDAVGPVREIVVAGDPAGAGVKAMLRVVRRRFLPEAVIAVHPAGEDGKAIEALVPFVKEQRTMEGKATAYVCRNYACERPTTEIAKLEALLDAPDGGVKD